MEQLASLLPSRAHPGEIIIADGVAADVAQLLSTARLPVITLGATLNPLLSMTAVLAGEQVDTLHIVAHGCPGAVQIGGTWIDQQLLRANASLLRMWQVRKIALWSCEVAGQAEFIDTLSELTGAEVYASAGLIGNSGSGHAWTLALASGATMHGSRIWPDYTLQTTPVSLTSFTFVNAYQVNTAVTPATVEAAGVQYTWTSTGLGQAVAADGDANGSFTGNNVQVSLNVGGATYYGWITRPVKVNGEYVGFYFFSDPQWTSLSVIDAGGKDADNNASDNVGFLLVVKDTYFDNATVLSGTTNQKYTGSSSDPVDKALNSVLAQVAAKVTISNCEINEASDYSVFTLTNDSTTSATQLNSLSVSYTGMTATSADFNGSAATIEYSTDGTNWIASGALPRTGVPMAIGAKVYVRVSVTNDDASFEGAESFMLQANVGASSGATTITGFGTIYDDLRGSMYTGAVSGGAFVTGGAVTSDSPVTAVSSPTVSEGGNLVYTVSLNSHGGVALALDIGGSASTLDYGSLVFSNGVTYDELSGSLLVPAGVTSFTVTTATQTDGAAESDETLVLAFAGLAGTGTIQDATQALPSVTIDGLTTSADDTPTFSGTSANTSGDLTLTVNGKDYTVTPAADGSWSFTLPAEDALPDGDYTATISGDDGQGNTDTASDAFSIDALLPKVEIAHFATTTDNTPTFSGTSSNTDGDLTLTVNGKDYTVTPAADGSWSFTLPAEDTLADGDYTATIAGSDAAGNEASDFDDFRIDALQPVVSINDISVTADSTPTFSGSSANMVGDLSLTVNGKTYPVTPAADGSWSFTLPAGDALADGDYTATISGIDGEGNTDSDSDPFTVDAQAPTVSIANISTSTDTTPTFSGTSANTSGDLTLTVNGKDYTVTPAPNGNWSFTLPAGDALADGDYTASVSGSDGQGNEASDSDPFVIDALQPTVAIDGISATSDSTPTFSGTSANTDGDLTLTVNGKDYTVTPAADGSWSFTLPDADALIDGDYTATIAGSDAQGNPASATDSFNIDSSAPAVAIADFTTSADITPTFSGTSANIVGALTLTVNGKDYTVTPANDGSWSFTLPAGDALADGNYTATISGGDGQGNTVSASDPFIIDALLPTVSIADISTSADSTPTFSGTSANTDGDLTLTVNGKDYTVTPAPDGSWSFTLPAEDALADGDYTATIAGSDAQGNDSTDSDSFVIDALAPSLTIADITTSGDSTPTFSGTSANTDGDLTLTVNGKDYPVTPAADGSWSFTLSDADALIDGNYTATIAGSDAQGNPASAADPFTIDSSAPAVAIADITTSADTTPTFSGTSTNIVGDLTLTVNGKDYTVTPAGDGSWSFTLPAGDALADGNYTATISGGDGQGNTASASDPFVIDALLPTVSIADISTSADSTPTFSGTSANTDGDLTLTVNGKDYAVTPAADGSWSFTLPAGDALADGDYTATIAGSDAAGNEASDSDPFTMDAVQPQVTLVHTATTRDDTPTFTGSCANIVGDLTLTVNGKDYTVTPAADGSWSFTLPDEDALDDGDYTATISGGDGQGNVASKSDEFTVDALQPAVLITDIDTTTDNTPTFSGTSTNTDGDLTLTVNGKDYTVTPAADGSWSFTLPAEDALDDGDYTATIAGSDAHGNTDGDTDPFTVDAAAPTLSIDDIGTSADSTPTFSGTSANISGNLTLTVNGKDYPVTPAADGSWSFTLPDGDALADGDYTATIAGNDAQNNPASASDSFTVDAEQPLVTINDLSITPDTTPTFSGTSANISGPLTLTVNGKDYTVTPAADGSWSFTLPDADALANGDYTVSVSASDEQGETVSDSDAFEVAVFSADLNPADDTGEPDRITGEIEPAFTLNGGSYLTTGGSARLLDADGKVAGSTTITSADVSRGSVDVAPGMLDDGTYTFIAEILDADGKVLASAPVTVTIITDRDGVMPSVELAANGGDFNGDGVLDWRQNNVAQLPISSYASFVAGKEAPAASFGAIMAGDVPGSAPGSSVQLDNGAQLVDVSIAERPAPVPDGLLPATPLMNFSVQAAVGETLTDIAPDRAGLQVRVVIDLQPGGVRANTYLKWDAGTQAYYEFLDDGDVATYDDGATLLDLDGDGGTDRVVLTLTDGAPGDEDGLVNGVIVDPGLLALDDAAPVYSVLLKNGDRFYTSSAAEAAQMARGAGNQFEGARFDSQAGAQKMVAWYNPYTRDWFFGAEGQDAPYACFVRKPEVDGFQADAPGEGGTDFHLFMNKKGVTQLVTLDEAATLKLASRGYLDKGALFSASTDGAFSFDAEGYLVANQADAGVQALVASLAGKYASASAAGFVEAVEQHYLAQVELVGLPHGTAASVSELNAAFGTSFGA